MAVYLSPGVFPVEIDISQLPTAVGPLCPAFIGTANKGPMNTATYISNSQQFIDTFGTPFPESYLGYAVLAYMEEGNQCYVMRVGIECSLGQPDALAQVCIDTSGARVQGWGRIPIFTGIDYGRIGFRAVSDAAPLQFNYASVPVDPHTNWAGTYNDVELSSTYGPTQAGVLVDSDSAYIGAIDDSFVMILTSAPSDPLTSPLDGCAYQIVRNSDGQIVASGALADSTNPTIFGTSEPIDLGNGILIAIQVTPVSNPSPTNPQPMLGVNDTFLFDAIADNTKFAISVEGETPTTVTLPPNPTVDGIVVSFTTALEVVTALENARTGLIATLTNANPQDPTAAALGDFLFMVYTLDDGTTIPQVRTLDAGRRIQIMGTQGWALAMGSSQYAWDIPRSYLTGLDSGPYSITTQNNRVVMNVIGNAATVPVSFNLPVGLNQTPTSIAASISAAGVQNGQRLFDAFAMTIPDLTSHVVIISSLEITTTDHSLDTLYILANFSNLKTLRFAEELGIQYPYQKGYRGYIDYRVALPDSGESDAATPLSCETDPYGDQCVSDAAYFAGIVGWLVAPSPGTWLTGYTVAVSIATGVPGDAAGLYNLSVSDPNGNVVDSIQAVSFDVTQANYIGNYLNPGTTNGGANGDAFLNWEARPSYLNFDPNSPDYTVRNPSPFANQIFEGMANGIPLDPAYSSELDAAIIGNPAESSGLYAFQNPETIDINLLCIPGFSSGAVIGQGLAMCEARGDVLYLVDPPFGLRPQQAVDWHNGMLLSDLTAAINSSYGALYWGWLLTYDQFSGNNVWVPPSGHIAAIFSRTARVAEQWFAPAGLNRGIILTALDVEYSPSQGERDLLYGSGNAVNPIVNFPKDGITVWGQRTLQREQTALDRVNVRMLLIYIKKNLIQVLRAFVFEPNDQILWAQVTAVINPFLGDIVARRGLTAFNVVCDATNNTPDRIDANQLWVSVFLKPTRAVEFIVLNLVIMSTSASFTAEEVLAAGGVVGTTTT